LCIATILQRTVRNSGEEKNLGKQQKLSYIGAEQHTNT
jgi:hypothetical protein